MNYSYIKLVLLSGCDFVIFLTESLGEFFDMRQSVGFHGDLYLDIAESGKIFELVVSELDHICPLLCDNLSDFSQFSRSVLNAHREVEDSIAAYQPFVDHGRDHQYIDIATTDHGHYLFILLVKPFERCHR